VETNGLTIGIGRGLSTGFALGVTAGIGYIACALAFRLWPEAGEIARLATIARVAAAKGWGRYAEQLGFSGGEREQSGPPRTDAVRLREAPEELGPTFVKFGQMLSQREDLFPAELASFDGQPMAAASMAPVHCALLPDGTQAIVKVQRRRLVPHVEGIPLLGIIGFIVAGALGVAWAAIALKSGRL
jgi:hypothetical protein